MNKELTNKDYINILKFYNINIPKSKRILKLKAEHIMSEKLCKCIKKLDPTNEAKSIGICTKTIFNDRGFTRGSFRCKKPRSVKFRKNITRKNITRKNITRKRK